MTESDHSASPNLDGTGWRYPLTEAEMPSESYKAAATWSLICAVVGIFTLPPVLGPVAIVLGVSARKKMQGSNNFDGAERALAAIIIGAIETVISVAIILFGAYLFWALETGHVKFFYE
jgi:uncharacterized protein YqgC (DUF456 family)